MEELATHRGPVLRNHAAFIEGIALGIEGIALGCAADSVSVSAAGMEDGGFVDAGSAFYIRMYVYT